MRLFLGTVLIAFSLSFISCGGSAPADAADMTNAAQGLWRLEKTIASDGSSTDWPRIDANFSIGESDQFKCTQMSYYYKISGSTITVYVKFTGVTFDDGMGGTLSDGTTFDGTAYERTFVASDFNGVFIEEVGNFSITDKYFDWGFRGRVGIIQISGDTMTWDYRQYSPSYFTGIRVMTKMPDESAIAGAADRIW